MLVLLRSPNQRTKRESTTTSPGVAIRHPDELALAR